MSTREAINLQPGDITTFIDTTVRGNGIHMPVDPGPGASWDLAAEYAGENAELRHDATLMRVHYIEPDGTYGVILDSTDPNRNRGEATRVSPTHKHFLGGENNSTEAALERAGVRVHEVVDMTDPKNPRPGIQVESPWKTLRQNTQQESRRLPHPAQNR